MSVRGLSRVAILLAFLAAPIRAGEPDDVEVFFGSKPDVTFTGALGLFVADLKKRSHFGFDDSGARNGEVAFGVDLGTSKTQLLPWVSLRADMDVAGWVGAEATGLVFSNGEHTIGRERQIDRITLSPGDRVRSHGSIYLARIAYGYEVRVHFSLGDVKTELYASPDLGVSAFDLHARVRRASDPPTHSFDDHVTAVGFGPGLHAGVELWEHMRLGVDYVVPLSAPITATRFTLLDRLRIFAGARFLGVEGTIGWRLAATHVLGGHDAADVRFRGFDFSLGVRF